MSDTTIDSNDLGARLELLAEQTEKNNTLLSKLAESLVKFSNAAVVSLAGQSQAAPAAPVARRGRPPKAVTAPRAKAEPEALHATALRMLDIIQSRGRVTQSELAEELGIKPSLVRYHGLALVERGKAVRRTTKPNGVETAVYYRPDWCSFRGE